MAPIYQHPHRRLVYFTVPGDVEEIIKPPSSERERRMDQSEFYQQQQAVTAWQERREAAIHQVFAIGNRHPIYYIKGNDVYSHATGKRVFYIDGNWLQPDDGSKATLYFDIFSDPYDPNPGINHDEELAP